MQVVGHLDALRARRRPEHPTVLAAAERFFEAVAEAEQAGLAPSCATWPTRAATLVHPSAHADLVRPGIAMYGLTPVPQVDDDFGLRPAMTLRARLALVKRLPAGQGISYGHAYVDRRRHRRRARSRRLRRRHPARRDQRRPPPRRRPSHDDRRAGLHGPVRRRPRTRRTGARRRRRHALRRGAAGEPTAQDWADATDTISYEIVTRLGAAGAAAPRRRAEDDA